MAAICIWGKTLPGGWPETGNRQNKNPVNTGGKCSPGDAGSNKSCPSHARYLKYYFPRYFAGWRIRSSRSASCSSRTTCRRRCSKTLARLWRSSRNCFISCSRGIQIYSPRHRGTGRSPFAPPKNRLHKRVGAKPGRAFPQGKPLMPILDEVAARHQFVPFQAPETSQRKAGRGSDRGTRLVMAVFHDVFWLAARP